MAVTITGSVYTAKDTGDSVPLPAEIEMTVPADAGMLIASVCYEDGSDSRPGTNDVVWDADAGSAQTLTRLQYNENSDGCIAVFYLLNPTSGSGTLSLDLGAEDEYIDAAFCCEGLDTADPLGAVATSSGNSSSPAVTVSDNAAGDLVLGFFGAGRGTSISDGGGQTRLFAEANGAGTSVISSGGAYKAGTGSNVALSWTLGGSDQWACIGFAVQAAPAATYDESIALALDEAFVASGQGGLGGSFTLSTGAAASASPAGSSFNATIAADAMGDLVTLGHGDFGQAVPLAMQAGHATGGGLLVEDVIALQVDMAGAALGTLRIEPGVLLTTSGAVLSAAALVSLPAITLGLEAGLDWVGGLRIDAAAALAAGPALGAVGGLRLEDAIHIAMGGGFAAAGQRGLNTDVAFDVAALAAANGLIVATPSMPLAVDAGLSAGAGSTLEAASVFDGTAGLASAGGLANVAAIVLSIEGEVAPIDGLMAEAATLFGAVLVVGAEGVAIGVPPSPGVIEHLDALAGGLAVTLESITGLGAGDAHAGRAETGDAASGDWSAADRDVTSLETDDHA